MRREKLICYLAIALVFLAIASITANAQAQALECVSCHEKTTPKIVADFRQSRMWGRVDCQVCHGTAHRTAEDYAKAKLPSQSTCGACHNEKLDQFLNGKHALAWIAMNAIPMTAKQPKEIVEGEKGCGGCHAIGKNTEDPSKLGGKCGACHTRHKFSAAEAREPESCSPCHMGFDHPQWEMWSQSTHGKIYLTERALGGNTTRAPKCITCHMSNGNHTVVTAWGFLGLRVEEPDSSWAANRTEILKALGVLTPNGTPTARLEVVKIGKVARLTMADWNSYREEQKHICRQCHAADTVNAQFKKYDAVLRESDGLMAEGIKTVAGLYKDGILEPKGGYPDLLAFYEAKTPIEQELYIMFLEHRNRAFQGAFHDNWDYMHWYGWAELKTDLVKIKDEAKAMREAATAKKAPEFEAIAGLLAVMLVYGIKYGRENRRR